MLTAYVERTHARSKTRSTALAAAMPCASSSWPTACSGYPADGQVQMVVRSGFGVADD